MQQQQTPSKPRGKPGRPKGLGPTPASWKPGQSGNPRGAEPSPAGRVARTLMAATESVREQLAEKIIEQALSGCLQSQRLLIERFMPQVRAQTLAQPLPGIEQGSIEQRLQVVLKAAAEGQVSADEAKVLVDSIRAATEAAAIAAAERELQAIREMRAQALLANATGAHQEGPQSLEMAEEVPRHV
jgi:Family of unknown function (DUF5681)